MHQFSYPAATQDYDYHIDARVHVGSAPETTMLITDDEVCEGNERVTVELRYLNTDGPGSTHYDLLDNATIEIIDDDCKSNALLNLLLHIH